MGLGYHQISLAIESDQFAFTHTAQFMLAPRSAYSGSVSTNINSTNLNSTSSIGQTEFHKPWGISTQLYSIKSDTQWGIGDFNDLQNLITFSAEQGADFILLNPLHALGLPDSVSPYSPDDRRRLNPLYIHIESVDEFAAIADYIETNDYPDKKGRFSKR